MIHLKFHHSELLKHSIPFRLTKKYHHGEKLPNLPILEITNDEIVNLHKQIGINVKKYRKEKGITQLDLALALGYKSVSSIAKAESFIERKHFNIEQLYKISKALGVEISKFFEVNKM